MALKTKNGGLSGKSPKFGSRNAEDILDEAEEEDDEDDEGSIRGESDENQCESSFSNFH